MDKQVWQPDLNPKSEITSNFRQHLRSLGQHRDGGFGTQRACSLLEGFFDSREGGEDQGAGFFVGDSLTDQGDGDVFADFGPGQGQRPGGFIKCPLLRSSGYLFICVIRVNIKIPVKVCP